MVSHLPFPLNKMSVVWKGDLQHEQLLVIHTNLFRCRSIVLWDWKMTKLEIREILSAIFHNLFATNRMQHKTNSSAEYNWFKFRVFPSLRLVAIPRLKSPVYPKNLSTTGEKRRIHTFPRRLSRRKTQKTSCMTWTSIADSISYVSK